MQHCTCMYDCMHRCREMVAHTTFSPNTGRTQLLFFSRGHLCHTNKTNPAAQSWCNLIILEVTLITVRSVSYHLCEKTLNKKEEAGVHAVCYLEEVFGQAGCGGWGLCLHLLCHLPGVTCSPVHLHLLLLIRLT